MLPEVGDLQRSSDVAEPSLMSHRPAAKDHNSDLMKFKIKQAKKRETMHVHYFNAENHYYFPPF